MVDQKCLNRTACLFTSLVLLLGSAVAADDEAVEAGRESALAWLALVDGDKGGESWVEAASVFNSQVTQEKWVSGLKQFRGPLGGVRSRELSSSKFSTELPSAPEGDYVVLEFATSFENQEGATERVVVMLDVDGEFRVVGYGIQ